MQENIVAAESRNASSKKIFYFDFIRAIACLSVVMIHTSMSYVLSAPGSMNFWIGNFLDSVSRAGVPLFLMISGALMLDEGYVLTRKKVTAHIRKLAVFFVGWSVIYCVAFEILLPPLLHEQTSAEQVLECLINGFYHLWFVPLIIGIYLMLPLLKLWIKRENVRYVEYFLGLSLVFVFAIPHALELLSSVYPLFGVVRVFDQMKIGNYISYLAYFVLGWYLNNREVRRIGWTAVICAAAAAVTMLGTYFEIAVLNAQADIFYSFVSVNVLIYTASIFVLCRAGLKDVRYSDCLLHRGIKLIVKNSLGIYAIHAALTLLMVKMLSGVHAAIAVPAVFLAAVLLAIAATTVLRRIPVLRKLV